MASSCEPVPSSSRASTVGSRARQANSCGTSGRAAMSLAAGENHCPASPPKGSRAAFRPTMRCGSAWPSSAIRTATAAPAECPTSRSGGGVSSACSSAPSARAMPCRPSCGEPAPPGGMPVKAWPGRSTATTVAWRASSGARSRQLWVEAPVPCSSRQQPSAWPSPGQTCTCQCRPPACTKRLRSACGQPGPSRCQSRSWGMGADSG